MYLRDTQMKASFPETPKLGLSSHVPSVEAKKKKKKNHKK
jgi:hypothetical protein